MSEQIEQLVEMAIKVNEIVDGVESIADQTNLLALNAAIEAAKVISKIDDELSEIVRDMISSLNGGKNAITNEELLNNLSKAKEAHSNWMKSLKRMVDEMKNYPIQTNSRKCAFGHFYHSIDVTNSDIAKEWTSVDKVHSELHSMGTKII